MNALVLSYKSTEIPRNQANKKSMKLSESLKATIHDATL